MLSYIFTRLLAIIPTLFGVLTISFIVTQFVPGGPVEQMLLELQAASEDGGEAAGSRLAGYEARAGISDQQVEELRRQYGFDRPPLERYLAMIWNYLSFDLGESYFRQESVWNLILSKLPVSISLGLWTVCLTYLVSLPLGVAKAVRAGSRFDLFTSIVVLLGYSIPGFVMGVLLLLLFGGGSFWQLFPLRGLTSDNWESLSWGARVLDYLWHITLPVFSMVIGGFAMTTMLTKNTILEEIRRQYVLTARAKGLSNGAVLYRHVFRNALLPLVTGFPSAFIAAFFSGSVLIETLFSLDGIGLLSYESVIRRDYPVVLGMLYLFTLIGLAAKLITDLCYVLVDPRIKFGAVGN